MDADHPIYGVNIPCRSTVTTTIWSSTGQVAAGDHTVAIGDPIANTQIHILDARDQLVPIGVFGDVYIGGDGLARGYFNRPDLTAAAFRQIALAGRPAQTLYKTGGVGRRRADGSIQLLGRKDQQIKLRGYRIELEDIESHLRRTPGLADAAVALHTAEDGDARLVGYYVTADTDRWLPFPPAWRSIAPDHFTFESVKVSHGEMFREEGSSLIGNHLKKLLETISRRPPADATASDAAKADSKQKTSQAA